MDQHFWPPILALSIPLVALLVPIIGIISRYRYKAHKDRLKHETLRKFAEAGQPVPPELLASEDEPFVPDFSSPSKYSPHRASAMLRKGMVSLFLGIGIMTALYLLNTGHEVDRAWAIGLVPAMLGLGWLLVWRIEARQIQTLTAPKDQGSQGADRV